MKITKPAKLNKGDLIGIIAPASMPADESRIEKSVKYFEKLGYNVEVGQHVGERRGYLAGEDENRLEDLHYMFGKKEVKAIICVRGGYGTGRLLEKINYNLIKKNPKIFVGYSDITALQMAFFKKTGLVTFGGPMAAVDFWGKVDPYTEEMFWKILTNTKKIGKLLNPDDEKFYTLNKGRGEGKLLGGNLAVLTSLLGSQYFPNFKDNVLIIEEVDELPYKIDRMFYQLRISNVLKDAAGILLGRFVDCYEKDKTKDSLTLNEVIEDYFKDIDKPVLYNIKHGHVKQTMTLPYGLNCKVNASRCFIEITEGAVV